MVINVTVQYNTRTLEIGAIVLSEVPPTAYEIDRINILIQYDNGGFNNIKIFNGRYQPLKSSFFYERYLGKTWDIATVNNGKFEYNLENIDVCKVQYAVMKKVESEIKNV